MNREQSPARIGRYEIRGALATGGMGSVWDAYDPDRHRPVAIKRMIWRDAGGEALLRREFRIAADIWHPNVVRLFELFEDGDQCFVAMERLDACPVDLWWRAPGAAARTTDSRRLWHGARQLALGVSALHSVGLLHLDLKPSNALVQADERVVLIDFGIAARRGEIRGQLMGTPGYMAPELAESLPLDAPADWFAFGAMLVEALAPNVARKDSADDRGLQPLVELGRALLEPDPGSRPGGAEVLAALALNPPRTRASMFVGRRRELDTLGEVVCDAAGGRPVLVHLAGGSGSGKSSLLAEFMGGIAERATVLHSPCSERDTVAFNALDPAMDHLVRQLAVLEPLALAQPPAELFTLGVAFPALMPSSARFRPAQTVASITELGRALLGLFSRLGSHQTVVFVVDDAHWGDPDSARLLQALLDAPARLPLVLLLAFRPEDLVPGGLVDALGEPEQRINLAGLDVEDVAEALALRGIEGGAAAVHRSCGGSPFLLERLVVPPGGGAPTDGLAEKLSALGSPDVFAIRCVALAAFPLTIRQLASLDIEAGAGSLERLAAERFTRQRGVGREAVVEVYHDRIRGSVLAGIPNDALREVHHRLALLLGSTGDPAALVHHLLGAGDEVAAGEAAERAARSASAVFAHDRAAELWRVVVRTRGAASENLFALAEALEAAGRCAEAAVTFLEVSTSRPACRLRAARCFYYAGDPDAGNAAAAPDLVEAGLSLPPSRLGVYSALVIGILRLILGWPRPFDQRRSEVALAVEDGLVSLDPIRATLLLLNSAPSEAQRSAGRALAHSRLGLFWASRGRVAKGSAMQAWAESASADDSAATRVKILVNRAKISLIEGRFEHARATADAARALSERERCETAVMPSVTRTLGLFCSEALGELETLAARCAEARWRGRSVGDRLAEVTAELYLAELDLAGDRPAHAWARVESAMNQWRASAYTFQHWLALRKRVLIRLYQGEVGEARRLFLEAAPALRASHLLSIPFVAAGERRLRALCRASTAGSLRALRAAATTDSVFGAEAAFLVAHLDGRGTGEAEARCAAAGLKMQVQAAEHRAGRRVRIAGVAAPVPWGRLFLPS